MNLQPIKLFLPLPANCLVFHNVVPLKQNFISFDNIFTPSRSFNFINFHSLFAFNYKLLFFFKINVNLSFIIFAWFNLNKFFGLNSNFIVLTINSLKRNLVLVSYGFLSSIQLIGHRYRQRWFKEQCLLKYSFGFNKKIWLRCPQTFVSILKKYTPKKRRYFYFSFNKISMLSVVYTILSLRGYVKYTGLGLNVCDQPVILKEGKKAMW
jgi:ribosomal protein L6P/L9E